jgi:putative flippase GtrA
MRWRESLRRFLKFNATTGALSIAGNAAAMKVLVGTIHLSYLVANFSAIAACSLLNFVVSDRVVFEAEVR